MQALGALEKMRVIAGITSGCISSSLLLPLTNMRAFKNLEKGGKKKKIITKWL